MNEPTRRPIAVADYVVVGTGSAGSVVAARLSADERNQVVVLEAGPKDNDRRIHMPVTWLQLFRSKFDWDYLTEPQPELNGRRIYWPRGKRRWVVVAERHDVGEWVRRRLRRVGPARRS